MLSLYSLRDLSTLSGRVVYSAVACESPKRATRTGVGRRVGVGVGVGVGVDVGLGAAVEVVGVAPAREVVRGPVEQPATTASSRASPPIIGQR
jgi:hypothetical protein